MSEVSEKTKRQRTILEALRDESVGSQEALAAALRRRGFDATQATLSRDLHELRIMRIPTDEGYRYARADEGAAAGTVAHPGGARLRSVTAEEVTGVDANETAVLVRTLTGRAQGVGVFLDGLRLPEVLGTIAGDDTLLVIPRSVRSTGKLKLILARLFGTDGAQPRAHGPTAQRRVSGGRSRRKDAS